MEATCRESLDDDCSELRRNGDDDDDGHVQTEDWMGAIEKHQGYCPSLFLHHHHCHSARDVTEGDDGNEYGQCENGMK